MSKIRVLVSPPASISSRATAWKSRTFASFSLTRATIAAAEILREECEQKGGHATRLDS